MNYYANLWEKFRLGEKAKDYRTVFRGDDFALGCAKTGQECAESFGAGGTMHANKDGMEMALEQCGKIVLYIGPAQNKKDGLGKYCGLILKE